MPREAALTLYTTNKVPWYFCGDQNPCLRFVMGLSPGGDLHSKARLEFNG